MADWMDTDIDTPTILMPRTVVSLTLEITVQLRMNVKLQLTSAEEKSRKRNKRTRKLLDVSDLRASDAVTLLDHLLPQQS